MVAIDLDLDASSWYATQPAEPQPWWQVDVQKVVPVTGVTVHTLAVAPGMTETQVWVGKSSSNDFNDHTVCFERTSTANVENVVNFPCTSVIPGRIIVIERIGVLTLQEVQINILGYQGT